MNKKTKKGIVSVGIDLSLVGTGLVILEDGKIRSQGLIKSKPCGDRPIDELNRIRGIVREISSFMEATDIDIAVIEGLAFMARNSTSLVQLSALNYMTRELLVKDHETPFLIVAPTSLKKFITGNGAAKKDVMLIETYKRYGVTILDDNENDAYGLAQIGLAMLGGNSKVTIKKQDEVLSLLKKQL